jgi:hypothetical protein
MKRILYISSLIFTVLFSSCDDALDVVPENSVTIESFYETEEEIDIAVNSIKLQFKLNHCLDASTDFPYWRGESFAVLSSWILNFGNIKSSYFKPSFSGTNWVSYYQIINSANLVLDHIGDADLSEEKTNFYRGQALFYRAFSYFELARRWGEAPIITASDEVGKKAKAKWNEVVEFAMKDAEMALSMLPGMEELGNSFRDSGNKESCNALLTHIYAWYGSLSNSTEHLQKAVDAATFVINSSSVSLATDPEEVCTSVLVGESKESVFEIFNNVSEFSTSNEWNTFQRYVSYPVVPEDSKGSINWKPAKIHNDTVEKMFEANDLRLASYFYQFETMKADDASVYAYPYKYRKIKTGTDSWNIGKFDSFDQHIVVLRLADIILLRAECNQKLGNDGDAIADLNMIRNRANATAYPAAGETDLKYAIFKEREKELLWEGVRYYDVVRNGYWKTELGDQFKALSEQDIADGALYLPVNQRAFTNNPLMTQNKYWLRQY